LLPRLRRAPPPATQPISETNIQNCLAAIQEMIRSARAAGVGTVMVVQHLDRREYGAPEWAGHAAIGATVRGLSIEPLQLGPYFRKVMDQNQNPYRDDIHPNELGQQIMADAIFEQIQMLIPSKH
jgi:hypothetical protein